MNASADEQFTRRALALARRGVGLTSPSPSVGALIVDSGGNVVGEGVYTYQGKKHAEILALEQAGDQANGATLYINLEPHAHQGRTPPCTDALIAAGIRRVAASMADPNPKVSGRGFAQLRAAGVTVDVGMGADEARILNESFARYIRHNVPFVTLKSAMTLDGKIAPPPAASPSPYFSPGLPEAEPSAGTPAGGWITGSAARAHVHEQRHRSDAIVVGIGTVLADDPLLTDRSGHPRRRPLLRIILDSTLRLPLHSRLARSVAKGPDGASDVLLFCSRAESAKQKEFAARGLRVETISAAANGRPDFAAMLRRLGELEVTSLLLEGGSALNASALELGLVDKLFLYYAPRIFPGSQAVPFAAFSGSAAQAPVLNLKRCRLHRFDEDFAVEGYLHDPYQD